MIIQVLSVCFHHAIRVKRLGEYILIQKLKSAMFIITTEVHWPIHTAARIGKTLKDFILR